MQTILVWVIVALAALYLIRKYSRALSGKGQGCDCDSPACKSCPQSDPDRPCAPPKSIERGDDD